MNLKMLMNQIDALVREMDSEKLKNCIFEIAYELPVNERKIILEILRSNDYKYLEVMNPSGKLNEKALLEINKIKEKLTKYTNHTIHVEINDYDFDLDDYYYDYNDDSYEYLFDNTESSEIIKIINYAVDLIYEWVDLGMNHEAVVLSNYLLSFGVGLESDYYFKMMNLQFLIDEKIVDINEKEFASLVMYATYQDTPISERANKLYSYLQYEMFHDVRIKDILHIGKNLKEFDAFIQDWITLLNFHEGDDEADLIIDALYYVSDDNKAFQVACDCVKTHPSVFLGLLEKLKEEKKYNEIIQYGKKALQLLNPNLLIRSNVATCVAEASKILNDGDIWMYLFEAFQSRPSIYHLLKIYAECQIEQINNDNLKMIIYQKPYEKTHTSHYYKSIELREYEYSYSCKYVLLLLTGDFDKGMKLLKEDISAYSNNVDVGVMLLLLYLSNDNNFDAGCQYCAHYIEKDICMAGLNFYRNDLDFDFLKAIGNWKKQFSITEKDKHTFFIKVRDLIDGVTEKILQAKERRLYVVAAAMISAYGEIIDSKQAVFMEYKTKYPRFSAFIKELREFGFNG